MPEMLSAENAKRLTARDDTISSGRRAGCEVEDFSRPTTDQSDQVNGLGIEVDEWQAGDREHRDGATLSVLQRHREQQMLVGWRLTLLQERGKGDE